MIQEMYCHACHHEWQKQEDHIECPRCGSTSSEIITPENDPRDFHSRPAAQAGEQSTVSPPASTPATTTPNNTTAPTPDQGHATPATPATEGPAAPGHTAAPGSQSPHTPSPAQNGNASPTNNGPTVYEFRYPVFSGPSGVSFISTIVAGPSAPPVIFGPPHMTVFHVHLANPPASRSTETNNASPSDADATTATQPQENLNDHNHASEQPDNASQQQSARQQREEDFLSLDRLWGLARASMLHGLFFSLSNPADAIVGDAALTQEALDRIISQLRDGMPTGGAPPASQVTIDKCVRTRDLGAEEAGDTKCVICVEDMVRGEQAAELPCKHLFHGECVTPWLKMHNTCPVCRRPIEEQPVKPAKADPVETAPSGGEAMDLS